MAKAKGPELFELLARGKSRIRGERDVSSSALEPSRPASPPAARAEAGVREIVFSLDTAFVIFVAVLMLVASAFYLGYKRGALERDLLPRKGSRAVEEMADVEAAEGIEGLPTGTRITLTGDEYTLKLRLTEDHSPPELARLQKDANHVGRLLAREFAEAEPLEVMIFDNSKLYALGVGLFESRDDPRLRRLKERLAKDPGPPTSGPQPYGGCGVAQTGHLGKVVHP